MSIQANAGQVEKVLEDLIIRLSRSATSPEVRAALIEAKRLRNVTTRWAAIPPPPDARREMLTRVQDLISQVGQSLSKPPPAEEAKPPAKPEPKEPSKAEPTLPPISPKNVSPGAFKPTERAFESVRGRELPPTTPPGRPRNRSEQQPDSEGPPTLSPREARVRGLTPPPLPSVEARGMTPTSRSAALPAPDRHAPAAAARVLDAGSPLTPRSRSGDSVPPPSSPRALPPLRGRKVSDIPAMPLPSAADAFNSPFRGRTKTGLADAPLGLPDARTERSRLPTAPPPPLPGAMNRRETKVLGSQTVEEAIEALGEPFDVAPATPVPPKPPSDPAHDSFETVPPPSSAERSRHDAPTGPPPIGIPAQREGKVEGFSSALSLPSMRPIRGSKKPSNPTLQLPTPVPAPMRASAPPVSPSRAPSGNNKPLRSVVSPGVTIVRPEAAQWQAHPSIPGVTLKLLYRDPRTGVYTALLRLAPGAKLPRRRHAASEEVLLISGIASVGAFELRAGEYCRAESESEHEPVTTSTGCTLFVCGSEHDEFLDDP